MGRFEKFLFDTSFDREQTAKAKAAAAAQAVAEEPPAPTFTEEELAAAREAAEAQAPDAVAASLAVAEERGDDPDDVVFYRCVYLEGKNRCTIYEDRPALCRAFPESPFGAVPACCGYFGRKTACQDQLIAMKAELARLKSLQQGLREEAGPPGFQDG